MSFLKSLSLNLFNKQARLNRSLCRPDHKPLTNDLTYFHPMNNVDLKNINAFI